MKKNGFTLIELLAVIVILAIIALIAVPIVLNIIRDARESSEERSVELYAKAVKNAIMKKKIEEPKAIITGSYASTTDGKNLTGPTTLNVEYDGEVYCKGIQVGNEENKNDYKLYLSGCTVTKSNNSYKYTDGTGAEKEGVVTATGSNKPEQPKINYFAEDSWSTIISNVQNGNTSRYNVGDTKSITLASSDTNIAGTYTVRIANKSNDGDVCTKEKNSSGETYSKTACGFVIEFADIITRKQMNSNDTNVGGWPASDLYTYVNNDIYNSLPTEVKNAVIPTTVVSGHGKNDSPNKVSTDKLYLLSTAEIWKRVTDSSAFYLTRQLDYYSSMEIVTSDEVYSELNKQYNGRVIAWWIRSTYAYNTSYFFTVYGSGSSANSTYGVAPAFRIG